MKKALFVINPSSGKQNIMSTVETIIAQLVMKQIVNHVDVFYTKKKNDAKIHVQGLLPKEYDFVVSVGGDGTLNEVVNGLYRSKSNIPLAIISAGTVNDFATYLQLPQTPDKFVDMIDQFRLKDVDLGKVDDEYFINVLAGGLLTDIAYKVPKDTKAVLGKFAYYIEGAIELPKQMIGPKLKLKFESEELTETMEALVFLITNSKSVGGFDRAAPEASVSDGYLDVLVLKKVTLLNTPELLVKALQAEHHNHPDIEYFQTKKVRVELVEGQDVAIDYDGEFLEDGLPIDVSIIEKAVKVIIP